MAQIYQIISVLFLTALNGATVAATTTAAPAPPAQTMSTAETLLRDSKCTGCHALKFATAQDKTGNAIYTRKNRSVTSYAKLVAQVARCDTELNLQVFEDDQTTISQYLNTQFYHFSVAKAPGK